MIGHLNESAPGCAPASGHSADEPVTRRSFDRISKAFDLAQDGAKQLLTISAGIIVVTITFFSDFGAHASLTAKILMVIAWGSISYLLLLEWECCTLLL